MGANRYASREIGGIKSYGEGEGDVGAQSAGCQDAVLHSTVVESIDALREEVANLRLEVGPIQKSWEPLCLCIMLEASCAHFMLGFRRAGLR